MELDFQNDAWKCITSWHYFFNCDKFSTALSSTITLAFSLKCLDKLNWIRPLTHTLYLWLYYVFLQILISYSKFLMPRPLKSGGAGGAIASPEFVMKFCFSYFFGYLRLYGTWIGKQQKWYFVTIIVLTYCEKKLF